MSGRLDGSRAAIVAGAAALAILAVGSWRDPEFWRSYDQQGDALMRAGSYREAAEVYADPWRIGVAQYRNGDFKAAARSFARVPGATGAFNQGNALLMHGAYDDAIKSYDSALGFHPDWQEAGDNRALALARKQKIEDAGRDRDQEQADAYTPDDLVFDQKGDDRKGEPQTLNAEELSDAELRSTWLRRVQTSPGDFLRAKFAYQAAQRASAADAEGEQP